MSKTTAPELQKWYEHWSDHSSRMMKIVQAQVKPLAKILKSRKCMRETIPWQYRHGQEVQGWMIALLQNDERSTGMDDSAAQE